MRKFFSVQGSCDREWARHTPTKTVSANCGKYRRRNLFFIKKTIFIKKNTFFFIKNNNFYF